MTESVILRYDKDNLNNFNCYQHVKNLGLREGNPSNHKVEKSSTNNRLDLTDGSR